MMWSDFILKITPDVIVVGLWIYTIRTLATNVSELRARYELVSYEIKDIKQTLSKITVIKVKED